MRTQKTKDGCEHVKFFSVIGTYHRCRRNDYNSDARVIENERPSSSAWQSEGFVNPRSWVRIPPRALLLVSSHVFQGCKGAQLALNLASKLFYTCLFPKIHSRVMSGNRVRHSVLAFHPPALGWQLLQCHQHVVSCMLLR